MKTKLTNKLLLSFSLLTILVLILITEPIFFSLHKGVFNDFERALFEPLFVWSISLFVCSVVLLFFSQTVFKKWLKTILVWFLPIGLLITFLSDPSLSYVLPNRVGFAALLGGSLVLATLIFALVQKFKYKL